MRKYLIVLLMIITLVVVGCDNQENKVEDETKVQDNGSTETNKNENSSEPNTGENSETSNKEENRVEENDNHRVSFYLFYMSSCSYCHNERDWIASIENEYDYVDFKLYEISENETLYEKVRNAYNIESTSVPLTIIGNDYFIGYTSNNNRKFIRYIENLATFENCDVVATIIADGDVEACMKQNDN